MALIHYLLVYDHRRQKLLKATPFNNASRAAEAYADLERAHRDEEGLEIVLIGADSIDTIRQTHGNYFDGESAAALEELATASH
jgi:hypothetical protein